MSHTYFYYTVPLCSRKLLFRYQNACFMVAVIKLLCKTQEDPWRRHQLKSRAETFHTIPVLPVLVQGVQQVRLKQKILSENVLSLVFISSAFYVIISLSLPPLCKTQEDPWRRRQLNFRVEAFQAIHVGLLPVLVQGIQLVRVNTKCCQKLFLPLVLFKCACFLCDCKFSSAYCVRHRRILEEAASSSPKWKHSRQSKSYHF